MTKLSNFRSQWTQAPVMYTSEFETPEDGQYRVMIEEVKYTEVDKDNNPTDPTFVYILRVVEGEKTGMRFRKFQTLRTEKNLSFLKGDLSRLGLAVPNDPEEIVYVFQRAKGLTIDVTVKSREYNGRTLKDCTIDRLIKQTQTQQPQQNDPNYNPFLDGQKTYSAQPQKPQNNAPRGFNDPPFDPNYYENMPF